MVKITKNYYNNIMKLSIMVKQFLITIQKKKMEYAKYALQKASNKLFKQLVDTKFVKFVLII